jgi:hypothetical protein
MFSLALAFLAGYFLSVLPVVRRLENHFMSKGS